MESLQQRQPLRRSQRVTRRSGDVADRSLQRVEGRRDGLPVDDGSELMIPNYPGPPTSMSALRLVKQQSRK
jgi:hypothetical protein